MTDALSIRHTIAAVVRVYEQARADIAGAFAAIDTAEKRLNDVFTMEHWSTIHVCDGHSRGWFDFGNPERTLEQLKRDVWSSLVERLEIRRMLSIGRAKELDERLKSGGLPDITEESVFAFASFYQEHVEDMLGEAVLEVFDWLRPRRDTYKTNDRVQVGRKVILRWVVDAGFGRSAFRVAYNSSAEITAMENVFTALDGQGMINKRYGSVLQDAIEAAGPDGRGETAYFKFRACRNRNLHLEFKRADLLQRFNMVAGGRRLRPAPEQTTAPNEAV